MNSLIVKERNSFVYRAISLVVAIAFFATAVIPPSYAQSITALNLPAPGVMITPTNGFIPAVMKGIKIFPDNPLRFDFIIDTGNTQLEAKDLEIESSKLIKYFLASLTVPEDELWVNLSPYEKDRIIPDKFGVTEMGRDLLAQDYILKQLTASLIYPEEELGGEFWDRVYARAKKLYGTSEIPVNTFNKVWVVPEKATIYVSDDIAFIVESHLKVMLEGDYLALKENMNNEQLGANQLDADKTRELSDVSSQIIREVILPEIEKEVNKGRNFLSLRQIYNSMILATWFKRNLKESLLGKVYVEKNKVSGVDIEDKQTREKIYHQYLEAFKVGVYDYIKEDYDPDTQEIIPRKYFSGGMEFRGELVDKALLVESKSRVVTLTKAKEITDGTLKTVSAVLDPVKNLDRLRRILNILAQSDQVPQVPQGASEDVILEFILSHLQAQGLIKEVRDESTDVKVFVIKDEVKESELGRAVERWVMQPRGGVRAINFKGTDGIWKIVSFESDIDQQIDLEREEVQERKSGKHWIVAHNNARKKLRGGDQQIDQENAQQQFEVARRNIISASGGQPETAMLALGSTSPQVLAKEILGKILAINNDFDRWQEKYDFQKQLVSLGSDVTPLLIGVYQKSQSDDEKKIVLEAIRDIADEQAADFLFGILADNPDSYGVGSTAAYGLGRIGKAVSPRLVELFNTHGPKNNILIAIKQLKDDKFAPLLKASQSDDNEKRRAVAVILLTLGEKDGLVALVDLFESSVQAIEKPEEDAWGDPVAVMLREGFLEIDTSKKTKELLKEDSDLEARLMVAAKDMIAKVGNESIMMENLIKLLGLGSSDATASLLWGLYTSKGGHEALGRVIGVAMKEVGPASIPYLTEGGVKNELIYEMLGEIGEASAVPFLLGELRNAGYSNYNRRQVINGAIEKIGRKALPNLLEALEAEQGDNHDITRLLVSAKSPEAIPKMIEMLESDISEENKLNILEAFGSMEMFDQLLTIRLREDSHLRRKLFNLTMSFMRDGLKGMEHLEMTRILKSTASNEDVPNMIEHYHQNGIEVKKAIVGALATRTDNKTMAFLISTVQSSDADIAKESLNALNSLARTGDLIGYLENDVDKRDEAVELLKARIRTSEPAISILGLIGSERALDLLIGELERKVQQEEAVDRTLLEALMTIGDRARSKLLSEHSILVADVDGIITQTLQGSYSTDYKEEIAKDQLARTFRKWLEYVGGRGITQRPATREQLPETYISQREQVTNSVLDMKEELARAPDMAFEEIMNLMQERISGLSVRAQARFRVGVLNYLRDRKRVRKVTSEALKAGISDGKPITFTELQGNSSKARFVSDILGFVPENIQLFFLADTIHIVLDSESYGRMSYRRKTHVIGGAADGYNKLLPQERFQYQDSGGVYSAYQGGKVGEIGLLGLLTFESSLVWGKRDGHTLLHEVQHKFFHSYAEDELREQLTSSGGEVDTLAEEINTRSGEERERSVERLVDALVGVILFDFQNEMISRIIDGNWIKDKDISGWFGFYKRWYSDNVTKRLSKVSDEQIRETLSEKVFAKAESILKAHKLVIDTVIELKAELIEKEEGLDHELALEKANVWVATFIQTIPVTRFDRLNWLANKFRGELQVAKQEGHVGDSAMLGVVETDPAQLNTQVTNATGENVGGIDLNPNMLELQTQGAGVDFDIPFDPAMLQDVQIEGFSPVIFQIVPTNLPMLMGVLENEDEKQLSMAQ